MAHELWHVVSRHAPALADRVYRVLRARGTQVVQILDPRLPSRHWDLVVVPEHDALRGSNVLTLIGSLNPVDDDWLSLGRAAFADFRSLPVEAFLEKYHG